jgi:hypothetical protein
MTAGLMLVFSILLGKFSCDLRRISGDHAGKSMQPVPSLCWLSSPLQRQFRAVLTWPALPHFTFLARNRAVNRIRRFRARSEGSRCLDF